MVKRCFLTGMLMLTVTPTVSSAPLRFADGETRYACGKDCPETELVCVREARPAPAGLTTPTIAADIPWGQTEYWFMSGVIADRPAGAIVDGERLSEPVVVHFGGFDWVQVDFNLRADGTSDLGGTLLMWPEGDDVALLRCSFTAHARAEPMVQELARSLRE